MDQTHCFYLKLLSNGGLIVFFAFKLRHKGNLMVDSVSLLGNFQSPKDYSASDRSKFDMPQDFESSGSGILQKLQLSFLEP